MKDDYLIAVLCDLHLTDEAESPQKDALREIVKKLGELSPDCLFVLGDMTACGEKKAIDMVISALNTLNIPILALSGNSDRRNNSFTERDYAIFDSDRIDIGGVAFSKSETSGRYILLSHEPLTEEELAKLTNRPLAVIHGHKHRDSEGYEIGCRGMDPDKVIGGCACASLFSFRPNDISPLKRLDDVEWTGEKGFTDEDIDGFLGNVGLTLFNPLAELPLIMNSEIRHIELRAKAAEFPRKELLALLSEWRTRGGGSVSIHMRTMTYRENEVDAGNESVLDFADEIAAEYLTLHPPGVTAEAYPALADKFASKVGEMLCGKKHSLLLENVHTDFRMVTPRPYGCTPDELLLWLEKVRAYLPGTRLRLDIGHTRCNPPFTGEYPLSRWYSRLGAEIGGYHIHQVDERDGAYLTHNAFDSVHGRLISLGSFLYNWKINAIAHSPMILETHDFDGAIKSIEMMRKYLYEGKKFDI